MTSVFHANFSSFFFVFYLEHKIFFFQNKKTGKLSIIKIADKTTFCYLDAQSDFLS